MKTKKTFIRILMTLLLVSLLVGCTGGNKEPISTSGGGRTSGKNSDAKRRYAVPLPRIAAFPEPEISNTSGCAANVRIRTSASPTARE